MKNEATTVTRDEAMVDGERLLELLFPDPEVRPSMRWLKEQEKRRTIPFVRLGRLIFYFPSQVRAAIAERHTVGPKRSKSTLP